MLSIKKSIQFTSILLFLLLTLFIPQSCSVSTHPGMLGSHQMGGLLSDIRHRGKLVAITDNNPLNYSIREGRPVGYQYEMLEKFARNLGVRLEILVVPDASKAQHLLRQKRVDLLAMDLPANRETGDFLVSEPLFTCNLVNVTRQRISGPLFDTAALKQAMETRISTAINYQLANSNVPQSDAPFVIPGSPTHIDYMREIADGNLTSAVVPSYVANAYRKVQPMLDTDKTTGERYETAWVARNGANSLMEEVNNWLKKTAKEGDAPAKTYEKYFTSHKNIAYVLNVPFVEVKPEKEKIVYRMRKGAISPYDSYIKQFSKIPGWDWRLLAALIHTESGFRPEVVSRAGAFGLMQLMPQTANQYGVSQQSEPADHIQAGAKLIKALDRMFSQRVPDREERVKFILASYNAGAAHILDATKLAEKYNANPASWEDVEYYMMAKSKPEFYRDPVVKQGRFHGTETKNFVSRVLTKFDQYRGVTN